MGKIVEVSRAALRFDGNPVGAIVALVMHSQAHANASDERVSLAFLLNFRYDETATNSSSSRD